MVYVEANQMCLNWLNCSSLLTESNIIGAIKTDKCWLISSGNNWNETVLVRAGENPLGFSKLDLKHEISRENKEEKEEVQEA